MDFNCLCGILNIIVNVENACWYLCAISYRTKTVGQYSAVQCSAVQCTECSGHLPTTYLPALGSSTGEPAQSAAVLTDNHPHSGQGAVTALQCAGYIMHCVELNSRVYCAGYFARLVWVKCAVLGTVCYSGYSVLCCVQCAIQGTVCCVGYSVMCTV